MKRKIFLDILMSAVMLCLLNTNITGLLLHEILGIGIFVLFLVHKVFNFKWILAVTRNLFKKTLQKKARMFYILDVTLLVLAALNVITGLLISTQILTDFSVGDPALTSFLHHVFAYALLAALGVHVGLHWKFIVLATRIKAGSAAEKILCCVATAALVALLMSSNTISRYLIPKMAEDSHYQTEQAPGKEDDAQDPPPAADVPTLEQFLSKLICTGCGQRCLLTSPDCGRGRDERENAIRAYNETYHANEPYYTGDYFPSDRPGKPRK